MRESISTRRKVYLPFCIWKYQIVLTIFLQVNKSLSHIQNCIRSKEEVAFQCEVSVKNTTARRRQLSREFMVAEIEYSVFIWNSDVKAEHANYTMTFYDGW